MFLKFKNTEDFIFFPVGLFVVVVGAVVFCLFCLLIVCFLVLLNAFPIEKRWRNNNNK